MSPGKNAFTVGNAPHGKPGRANKKAQGWKIVNARAGPNTVSKKKKKEKN